MPFHQMSPGDVPTDPLVTALTLDQLSKDVIEYERLLDTAATEQAIHEFLANHSYFFNTILRLYGVSPLYAKVRLGSEFEIDFAGFDSGSLGPEWYFIEIEAPTHKLLTKAGDPSAALTHAMRQVHDWQAWVHENLDYARKLLPHIEYPLGYIFIGRRAELGSDTARKRLRLLNKEHRQSLEIHSLDWFASTARSVANILEREGHGHWTLPMRALSHAELSKGLPPLALEYLDSFFGAGHPEYPEEFLRVRKWKYEGQGDEEFV